MAIGVDYEIKRCLVVNKLTRGASDTDSGAVTRAFLNLDNVMLARTFNAFPQRVEILFEDGDSFVVAIDYSPPVFPNMFNAHSFFCRNQNTFEQFDNDAQDSKPGLSGGTAVDYELKRCLVVQEIDEDRTVEGVTVYGLSYVNMNHILWSEQKQDPNLNNGNPFMEVHLKNKRTIRVRANVTANGGFHSFGIFNSNTNDTADGDPEDSTP